MVKNMQKKLNADNFTKIAIYSSLLLGLLIVVFFNTGIKSTGDDAYFSKVLAHQDLFETLRTRYNTWSGRVTIEALLFSTINIYIFWMFLIPSSIVLMFYSLARIVCGEMPLHWQSIVFAVLFLFISPYVNGSATWWLTGFYNYTLPISLGLFAVSSFILSNSTSSLIKILSILSLVIACFNEQVSIFILLVAISISLITRNYSLYTISFIASSIILTLLALLAPGNKIRFDYEQRWIPEFSSYSLIEKLGLGIDKFSMHVLDPSNVVFTVLTLCCIAVFYFSQNKTFSSYVAVSILLLRMIFVHSMQYGNIYSHYFLTTEKLTPENWHGFTIYASYLMALFSWISCVYIGFLINNYRYKIIFICGLLIGAASIMMMSFSPTIYESGGRVLMLNDTLIIMSTLSAINFFYKKGR